MNSCLHCCEAAALLGHHCAILATLKAPQLSGMVVAVSATAAQLRLGIWYWYWFIMATHQDTVLDAILADCTSLTDRAMDVYLACKEPPFSGTTIA